MVLFATADLCVLAKKVFQVSLASSYTLACAHPPNQIRRKIAEAKVVKKVFSSQTLTSEDCQQLLKADIVIHKLLGKGGQAGVYLAENVKTGQTFALKRLLADTPGQDHYSQIEIGNTMRLEGCEHVVRYVRYFITPNGIRWLFLELARSDLHQLVCNNRLTMGMVSNLTVQVSSFFNAKSHV